MLRRATESTMIISATDDDVDGVEYRQSITPVISIYRFVSEARILLTAPSAASFTTVA
jgi:hypothetical protein